VQTQDLGQWIDTKTWSEPVDIPVIPGMKPELIFLYKGTLGLNGAKCDADYTEYEVPSGCSQVYFMGLTRILVIYTAV
jgi:hypothetical protein